MEVNSFLQKVDKFADEFRKGGEVTKISSLLDHLSEEVRAEIMAQRDYSERCNEYRWIK